MLIGNGFIQNDIKILEEFDLQSSYITDYDFQKFYKKYEKRYRKTYQEKMTKAHLFIPTIKRILKQNDMPSAFLYLAMAESNFKLKAKSYKKAMGIWQIMPRTAKAYGLNVDFYTDERMDIAKSTIAAIAHLKRLHKIFGKWYLASMAYNCGEARIIEGITRSSLDMYCKVNKDCTRDKQIRKYRQVIKDYQAKRVNFSKLYKVYKKVKKLGFKPDIKELLVVQKKLSRQYLPRESRYYIKKIISLAMMNNSEYLVKDENNHLLNMAISTPLIQVKVKGGILLKNIADVIGVTKKELQFYNPHIKKNIISPEKKYATIYIPYSKLSRFNKNIKNIKSNIFEIHIVKKGDNLLKLAHIYGTKVKMIKKFNNLHSNLLSLKQNLIIPIDPETYKRPKDYYVKKGDSLFTIARKFNVKIDKIKQDNNLKTSMLKIGDKLVIKFK